MQCARATIGPQCISRMESSMASGSIPKRVTSRNRPSRWPWHGSLSPIDAIKMAI